MARLTTARSTTSHLEVAPLVLSLIVALLVVIVVGVLLRTAVAAAATTWDHAVTPTSTPTAVTQ